LHHRHSLLTAALAWQAGTVYALLGSLSHVKAPELETFTNLYCTACPGVIFIVILQIGLLLVYCEAESAGAFAAFQLPSWAVLPAILIVSPREVTTRSVKETDTTVGHAVLTELRTVVDEVRRVVKLAVVGEAVEARRTIGSPLATLTQA
jgi:hypothetical protein